MTKHYTDEGTLLIRNSDIKDGKFEFGDNPIYLEKTFAEKNETRMHQIGDVITVHTGDVGTSAVITENEAKSIGFATIVTRPNPKIIDSNYLCSFLNTDKHKKWAVSISTGDGRTNYNLGDYFELVVPVPSIAEQKKIASYIQKLNRLITLHQCKCQIDGCRFQSPLAITWEQRKLTEFVEFFSGLTYTPNDVQENGTLVLRSSNVSNGEVVDADNIYVNPQVVNSENVKVGDIVVVVRNGSRSLIGKHAQIKAFMPNTVIGAFMTGIRSECPEFTNALLNTSRFEEEIAMNMGATINQITGYMFSKMEFKVPCLDEQKKIGEYFEKLDNLITLHQCE